MNESKFTIILMHVIVLISMAVWFVVGLVFWIPFLLRATFSFSAAVVLATFSNNQNIASSRAYLSDAINFWFNGFRAARSVLDEAQTSSNTIKPSFARILFETFVTSVFWLFFLTLYGTLTFDEIFSFTSELLVDFYNLVTQQSLGVFLFLAIILFSFVFGYNIGRSTKSNR